MEDRRFVGVVLSSLHVGPGRWNSDCQAWRHTYLSMLAHLAGPFSVFLICGLARSSRTTKGSTRRERPHAERRGTNISTQDPPKVPPQLYSATSPVGAQRDPTHGGEAPELSLPAGPGDGDGKEPSKVNCWRPPCSRDGQMRGVEDGSGGRDVWRWEGER